MDDHFENLRDMVRRVCAESDALNADCTAWLARYCARQEMRQKNFRADDLVYKVTEQPPPLAGTEPEIFDTGQAAVLREALAMLREEINGRCDDAIGALRDAIEKRLVLIERQLADLQSTRTTGLPAEMPTNRRHDA